ncbi:MAG TPA: alpha/beta fold hydrolase [Aliidongia sp.]|nr:alpha/beta fold hydrolase [Aliidongia sp.]
MRILWCGLALAVCLLARPAFAFDGGRLGEVTLTDPDGPARSIVVFYAEHGGFKPADAKTVKTLAAAGAIVVQVDTDAYLARLDSIQEACHNVEYDAELLSRAIQRERHFTFYLTPILVGRGIGGTLAWLALAGAPPATISGAVVDAPASAIPGKAPACTTPPARSTPAGWVYAPAGPLQGFYVAGPDLAAPAVAHLPATATALPLVELPADPPSDLFAMVLSGDGGWRDLDKTIAEALQKDGVSVVGLDSLRYFWSEKTPDELAEALEQVLQQHPDQHVALVGYSFGADVLPFAYNRLPETLKSRIVLMSFLGFAKSADFEITLTGWLGSPPSEKALPVGPELAKIPPVLLQCFYGEEEDDSICSTLPSSAEIIKTSGGHHFDGDYTGLAEKILDSFKRRAKEE